MDDPICNGAQTVRSTGSKSFPSRPTVASGCSNKPDARPRRPNSTPCPPKWTSSTSENPKHWNAVAHWFAADLQRRLGVPVGLLINCDDGTRPTHWTSLKTFQETKGFDSSLQSASSAKRTFESRRILYEQELANFMDKRKRRKDRTGSHLLRTRSEWILQRHDPSHKKIFNPGSPKAKRMP